MNRVEGTIEVLNEQHMSKGPCLGVRHLQAVLLFLNLTVHYLNRMHVAISLVAMTNAEKSNPDFPEFDWNAQQKSYILSSFYWGYILTQIPCAFSIRYYGAKINLFLYTLFAGLLTLLVPFCVPWGGWQIFVFLRFLQGLSQGGVYPAALQHLANWSPMIERSMLCGFVHTGFDCSLVVAMALSGIIAFSSLGWPGTFYIYAGCCFLWCALWLFFGSNNATKSNFISNEEKLYIEHSLKNSVDFESVRITVPWRAIFTSKAFYALAATRAVSLTTIVTLQTEWPSYMNGVFNENIKDNALHSSLPYVTAWFFTFIVTFIANLMIKRNLMSLTMIRKCFNAFGMWVPAIVLVFVGFLDKTQKHLAIIGIILIIATHSGINMGSILNPIDIAPNHAEMVISIVNTISNAMVLLGPLFVGLIVNNEKNRDEWQIAFGTFAAVLCIGDLFFLIWGTAKQQPWNDPNFLTVKNSAEQTELKETSNGQKI